MAKATTSKTAPQSETVETTIDGVNESLLALALETGKDIEAREFALVQAFAVEMTEGRMSVRGVKATITAATEQGAAFAYLSVSMAQRIEVIANLAACDSTPRTMTLGALNTLADRMERTANPAKGTSKTEQARLDSYALKVKKGSLKALKTKTDKAFKALKDSKTEGGKSGKVTEVALTVETVNALRSLIQKSQAKFDSEELRSAVIDLGVSLQVWFGEEIAARY